MQIHKLDHGGNKRCSTEGKIAFMWVAVDMGGLGWLINLRFLYKPGEGWIMDGSPCIGNKIAERHIDEVCDWDGIINTLWNGKKSVII